MFLLSLNEPFISSEVAGPPPQSRPCFYRKLTAALPPSCHNYHNYLLSREQNFGITSGLEKTAKRPASPKCMPITCFISVLPHTIETFLFGLQSTLYLFMRQCENREHVRIWVWSVTCLHKVTTKLARKYKKQRKYSKLAYMQVWCTPVCFDGTHYLSSSDWPEMGSVFVGFVSLGTLFHPWHPWQGAFLSDWWPHMTDGILHAYNQLMRPAADPRDRRARVGKGNFKKTRKTTSEYNSSRMGTNEIYLNSKGSKGKPHLMLCFCIRVAECVCVCFARVISHSTWHSCFHGNLWGLTCESERPAPTSRTVLLMGIMTPLWTAW